MSKLSRMGDFSLNTTTGLTWQASKRIGKPDAPWNIKIPIIIAVWFGLLTGLLELGSIYTRSHVLGWSSLSALQMSRHFHWMTPTANLAIFVGWGFVVGFLGRVWPSFGRRQSAFFLSFPAFLALLLMVPGLYQIAYVCSRGGSRA